uniref:Uncharacterized protein n=1 Tax=Acrobeloides nanus TaxID=290746 RepID=A0A914EIR1_9BILA
MPSSITAPTSLCFQMKGPKCIIITCTKALVPNPPIESRAFPKAAINEETALEIEGNFTFFINLNVYNFIDKNFTGCISRLRIGNSFPLKNPTESRLSYSGKIKFASCPYDQLQYSKPIEVEERSSDIKISSIVKNQQRLLLITPAIGVLTALLLAFALCIFVCYVRSRPDGVYKTNENVVAYCSPSKSAEPLVEPVFTKEYFC